MKKTTFILMSFFVVIILFLIASCEKYEQDSTYPIVPMDPIYVLKEGKSCSVYMEGVTVALHINKSIYDSSEIIAYDPSETIISQMSYSAEVRDRIEMLVSVVGQGRTPTSHIKASGSSSVSTTGNMQIAPASPGSYIMRGSFKLYHYYDLTHYTSGYVDIPFIVNAVDTSSVVAPIDTLQEFMEHAYEHTIKVRDVIAGISLSKDSFQINEPIDMNVLVVSKTSYGLLRIQHGSGGSPWYPVVFYDTKHGSSMSFYYATAGGSSTIKAENYAGSYKIFADLCVGGTGPECNGGNRSILYIPYTVMPMVDSTSAYSSEIASGDIIMSTSTDEL